MHSSADLYYAVAHREQQEIDSFSTRYENFDTSVITPIFKEYLNLTVTAFSRSESWGSSHVIYFVSTREREDQLVFRANLGVNPHPEVAMLVEQLVTEQVAALGVPTNRVLQVDISRQKYPFDFQIEEKLRGEDLEDHFTGTQEEYDQMSYQLGELIARYHQLKYPKFGRFDEHAAKEGTLKGSKATFYEYVCLNLESDLDFLVGAEVITAAQHTQIIRVFEQHQSLINSCEGVLIHHDLADHNIMFEGNQITSIFDWEAAVVGDPALDLASCPTWRTHYPREEQLLAGYQSIRSLPENYQDRRAIYLLRTMMWKTVYAIRMKILNDQRAERFRQALTIFQLR